MGILIDVESNNKSKFESKSSNMCGRNIRYILDISADSSALLNQFDRVFA